MASSELNMPDDGLRQVKNGVLSWTRASPTALAHPAPASHGRDGAAPAQEASMASLADLAITYCDSIGPHRASFEKQFLAKGIHAFQIRIPP
jgi:hypothetical protein